MGFWDKLKKSLRGSPGAPQGDPYGMWFHFRCNKCGSVVRIRAHKFNDINHEDGGPGPLVLRKDVMDNKCFQLMRAEIWLDANYEVVSAEVTGGKLISQKEYEAAQAQ
jgi:hypothetical protein